MSEKEFLEDIRNMIEEDYGRGDVTTECLIKGDVEASAKIISNEKGCVAGLYEVKKIFEELDTKFKPFFSDGDEINSSDELAIIKGKLKNILAGERVALNLLSRMSGVATATRNMIKKARRKNSSVEIAATRKTIPLLRRFDKKAVRVGGGESHRKDLWDFILIKDNHLKFVDSVTKAIEIAKSAEVSKKIEIEVSKKREALEAAKANVDIVMLDNFTVEKTKEAIDLLEDQELREEIVIESSGGIDLSNVDDYAGTGVDVISSSYMTMKSSALDIKLDVV